MNRTYGCTAAAVALGTTLGDYVMTDKESPDAVAKRALASRTDAPLWFRLSPQKLTMLRESATNGIQFMTNLLRYVHRSIEQM